jgi:hypothetical protein
MSTFAQFGTVLSDLFLMPQPNKTKPPLHVLAGQLSKEMVKKIRFVG